jgi:hypothetical protein
MIHSVFHLEHPSITIVVRNQADIEAQPQFDYHPPSVSVSPFYSDPLTVRRLQVLELVQSLSPERYEPTAVEILVHADVYCTYQILRQALIARRDIDLFSRLWTVAVDRHGEKALQLGRSALEAARQGALISLRESMTDADQRYMVALLLNVPDRSHVLRLVSERYSDQKPEDRITGAVLALAEADWRLLGCPVDDHMIEIVRRLIGGGRKSEIERVLLASAEGISPHQFEARWSALLKTPLLNKIAAAASDGFAA